MSGTPDRAARPRPDGGATTRYLERLLPSPGTWAVVVALALCSYVIVLPIDQVAAAITAAGVAVGCGIALLAASVLVGVRDGEVRAGRAHVPVRFVAEVEPLDRASTRHALGPGADARSLLRVRPWVHSSVLITLDDPDDPVPSWVVSTRRPEAFAAAVAAAKRSSEG